MQDIMNADKIKFGRKQPQFKLVAKFAHGTLGQADPSDHTPLLEHRY